LFQQKNDTGKIYSLHEPQVEYIAKDKAYYLRVCLNDPCRLNKWKWYYLRRPFSTGYKLW